jgi:CheY-like chemotaxis protein
MKKVLIADDYIDMRELLGRQIESLGFLPILAENGKDVLEKAVREKPRLKRRWPSLFAKRADHRRRHPVPK